MTCPIPFLSEPQFPEQLTPLAQPTPWGRCRVQEVPCKVPCKAESCQAQPTCSQKIPLGSYKPTSAPLLPPSAHSP